MMRIWEEFVHHQEKEIGVDSARRWLRTLRVLKFDAGNLYLEAKDAFQVLWFEEHIRPKIKGSLVNANGRPIQVHLSVAGSSSEKEEKSKQRKTKKSAAQTTATAKFALVPDELDPLCTYEHFYSAEGNLLAHKILCEVAGIRLGEDLTAHSQSQLAVFNPIYVYGRSGTGKTHLLMATTHALRQRGLNAIYTRAEVFTEHVVMAIRAGEMSAFRKLYRDADVFLIDDVHIFSRKAATQEELFHTFNTLHLANRQIVLSACCSPHELQLIEPRLVSRFEWGVVMPLEPLKREEFVQVLRLKSKALGFPLTPLVEQFLCEMFSSSPKALCQALEALVLRVHLQQGANPRRSSLTTEQLHAFLHDLMEDEERAALKPELILQKVAESYGIRVDDLTGRGQKRDTVLPRQLAMYVCRQSLQMPLTKIGELFHRDHSTVISSIRQIEKRLAVPDIELVADHTALLKKLQP